MKYTLKEFLTHRSLDQIVIPEIQRDYVWSKDNVESLLNSINSDFNDQKVALKGLDDSTLENLPPVIKELALRAKADRKVFTNIGFIYAYSGDGDISDKYFLIDGQQRMTTMYLLLLAMSIKEQKENMFRSSYFSHNIPKVDYKVRESAHDFLLNFVDYMLKGGNIKQVKDQYWYYLLYENDKTIQSLITNYSVVLDLLNQTNFDFDHVENNIELWYFDTTKSEQGEELYIYMNSRGEAVQANENIKAQLLEGLSDAEKHEKGMEWEEWQNFFWQNKDKNENADEGFNEFLRWIEIIGFIQGNPSITNKEQMEFVRSIRVSNKITTKYITLDNIDRYYKAVKKLIGIENVYFDIKWLSGVKDFINYVKILPALIYVDTHPETTPTQIRRFIRFFHNIIKNEDINKNPAIYTPQAIILTTEFLEAGLVDIAKVVSIKSLRRFANILNNEELFKFKLYLDPPDGFSREETENAFWKVEDFCLTNGRIEFILASIGFDLKVVTEEDFNLKKFITYSFNFRGLFASPNDTLRIAMLTFGDYTIYDGYSTTLEMRRFNFGSDDDKWREILKQSKNKLVLKELLRHFESLNCDSSEDYITNLEKIIEQCKASGLVHGWPSLFINDKMHMRYCRAKRACLSDDEVALLQNIKFTSGTCVRHKV